MERGTTHQDRESRTQRVDRKEKFVGERERTIKLIAQEAFNFIKAKTFTEQSTAIWRAIDHAKMGNQRGIYNEVKMALRSLPEYVELKRKEKEQLAQRRELDAFRKAEFVKGAWAHEKKQPRDAWDPFADEVDDE